MSDNTATQQPKLEARIRDACRVRHYSMSTERAYVLWYKQFVRWAGPRGHPHDSHVRWVAPSSFTGT